MNLRPPHTDGTHNLHPIHLTVCAPLRTAAQKYDDDTTLELRTWRRHIAHDIVNFDSLSGKSLAQRICDGDVGVHMSTQQNDRYVNLLGYIGGGNDGGVLGMLLCLLGLMQCALLAVRRS